MHGTIYLFTSQGIALPLKTSESAPSGIRTMPIHLGVPDRLIQVGSAPSDASSPIAPPVQAVKPMKMKRIPVPMSDQVGTYFAMLSNSLGFGSFSRPAAFAQFVVSGAFVISAPPFNLTYDSIYPSVSFVKPPLASVIDIRTKFLVFA